MGKTEIVAEPGSQQILMTREFAAPRELLFRAHVEPELLAQWLGPRRMTMVIDHLDARHGGTWCYSSRDTDGAEYGFRGVFHGTPSPDGIMQTFEFEGMPGHVAFETLTFDERDGKTTIRANSVYQSVADRDGMIESGMETGVNEGYERLDELIEEDGLDAVTPRRNPTKDAPVMEWKLEVVVVPVADVDRARHFYAEQLGFVVDHDTRIGDDARIVQLTPPGSGCSIVIGTGMAEMVPGSLQGLQLVVPDLDAARELLVRHGIDVSPIQHFDGAERVDGRGGDWNAFIFFNDPDGNGWAVQERPATR